MGDISTLVLDVGSCSTRAGFAGDSLPGVVLPSFMGNASQPAAAAAAADDADAAATPAAVRKHYLGLKELGMRRKDMDITPAMKDGLVSDWEVLEQIWGHVFLSELKVDPRNHPVLLTEPVLNTEAIREQMCQTIFESHHIPALFVAKSAVLTAFASGRSTALVFKSGNGCTTATPVLDGWAMQPQVKCLASGGQQLSTKLLESLTASGETLRPRPAFAGGVELDVSGFRPSYREFWMGELANEIKGSGCISFAEDAPAVASFKMPDGKQVAISGDVSTGLVELGFSAAATPMDEGTGAAPAGGSDGKYAQLIAKAIKGAGLNVEQSKLLYGNVIVTGGNSLIPGFFERLQGDTFRALNAESAHLGSRLLMVAPSTAVERHYSAWIGGSIVGSLPCFPQMWITAAEYAEQGPHVVNRKCP